MKISDGCSPSWITHLKTALQMLSRLETLSKTDDDLKAFCQIWFVAHDVMGWTAWEDDMPTYDFQWSDSNYQEVC